MAATMAAITPTLTRLIHELQTGFAAECQKKLDDQRAALERRIQMLEAELVMEKKRRIQAEALCHALRSQAPAQVDNLGLFLSSVAEFADELKLMVNSMYSLPPRDPASVVPAPSDPHVTDATPSVISDHEPEDYFVPASRLPTGPDHDPMVVCDSVAPEPTASPAPSASPSASGPETGGSVPDPASSTPPPSQSGLKEESVRPESVRPVQQQSVATVSPVAQSIPDTFASGVAPEQPESENASAVVGLTGDATPAKENAPPPEKPLNSAVPSDSTSPDSLEREILQLLQSKSSSTCCDVKTIPAMYRSRYQQDFFKRLIQVGLSSLGTFVNYFRWRSDSGKSLLIFTQRTVDNQTARTFISVKSATDPVEDNTQSGSGTPPSVSNRSRSVAADPRSNSVTRSVSQSPERNYSSSRYYDDGASHSRSHSPRRLDSSERSSSYSSSDLRDSSEYRGDDRKRSRTSSRDYGPSRNSDGSYARRSIDDRSGFCYFFNKSGHCQRMATCRYSHACKLCHSFSHGQCSCPTTSMRPSANELHQRHERFQ